MPLTYETLQNGKIREINTYSRGDIDVVEKRVLRLSEMEAIIGQQISGIEKTLEDLNAQLVALKKQRDDLVVLRA